VLPILPSLRLFPRVLPVRYPIVHPFLPRRNGRAGERD